MPARRQAIIGTNDDLFYWRIYASFGLNELTPILTHWGRTTYICVSKLTITASDNGLSPGWRQTIIWNNDGILLIGPLGTNFSEILIEAHTFSFNKTYLKMSSTKKRLFCLGLNVLRAWIQLPRVTVCHWTVHLLVCFPNQWDLAELLLLTKQHERHGTMMQTYSRLAGIKSDSRLVIYGFHSQDNVCRTPLWLCM